MKSVNKRINATVASIMTIGIMATSADAAVQNHSNVDTAVDPKPNVTVEIDRQNQAVELDRQTRNIDLNEAPTRNIDLNEAPTADSSDNKSTLKQKIQEKKSTGYSFSSDNQLKDKIGKWKSKETKSDKSMGMN